MSNDFEDNEFLAYAHNYAQKKVGKQNRARYVKELLILLNEGKPTVISKKCREMIEDLVLKCQSLSSGKALSLIRNNTLKIAQENKCEALLHKPLSMDIDW